MKMVHALQSEQVALPDGADDDDPASWSRPFDRARRGMVLGEGAGVLVLEELSHARARGARIYGEVLGHASRCSADAHGVGVRRQALAHAMGAALTMAGIPSERVGHVHAFGASTVAGDREEVAALHDVLGPTAARVPVAAAKANFGNLGGGSGLVECVASLLAMRRGELFSLRNYETPDPDCPIRAARRGDPAGDACISAAITPQGQAGALVLGGWTDG
jgi:3-oxoacyl-[acyl-carrier-protein] synthase II